MQIAFLRCLPGLQYVQEEPDDDVMTAHGRKVHGLGVSRGTLEAIIKEGREAAARYEAARTEAAAAALAAAQTPLEPLPFELPYSLARIKAIALAYLQALQELVQAQADALVQRFGGPPECRVVMRNLWFGFMPLTGLLDLDPRNG